MSHKNIVSMAFKMAQQVMVLITEPADLNSIPETHTVEGESSIPQVVL